MVTDHEGKITQNVVYIPYGEVFVEERNGRWASSYLFNAKELDEETGLYYYGARYLDPTSALWLSTDPLQGKYPGMSPYNYCAGNPVKLVDPDGRVINVYYMVDGNRRFEIYTPGASTNNSNAYVQRTFKSLNHIYSYESKNDKLDGRTIVEQLCSDKNTEVKIMNTELFPETQSTIRKNAEGDCYIKATIPWNPLVGPNLLDNNRNLTGAKPLIIIVTRIGTCLR